MTLPRPEPGLVIRYAYLWHRQLLEGREESDKDRPCAIVMTTKDDEEGRTRVWVVPVSHSAPDDPATGIELPAGLKRHLGLDARRSWAIVSETNDFYWPGPDLRRVGSDPDAAFAYGHLPPNFFKALRDRLLALAGDRRRHKQVRRTE